MKITKLEHIGIAVANLAAAEKLYREVLGLPVVDREVLADRKLNVLKLQAGGTILELLEAQPGEEVVSKFIAARGQGIHHLCFEVEDILAATEELKAKGYTPLHPQAKPGSGGTLVNFLRPKETLGVLIELNQPKAP